MGKRELIALLGLSSWCLVVVGRLFLAVPRGCLRLVIVVFPGHTHLLFLSLNHIKRHHIKSADLIKCFSAYMISFISLKLMYLLLFIH